MKTPLIDYKFNHHQSDNNNQYVRENVTKTKQRKKIPKLLWQ